MLAPVALAAIGCGGSSGLGVTNQRNVAYRWVETLLTTVSNSTLGPPVTARAIAMMTTAMYDAWACYDAVAVGTRLGGQLRRPSQERTDSNRSIAISYAAFRVLQELYPTITTHSTALMTSLGLSPTDASMDITTPTGIGNRVADELIRYRRNDGSNQLGGYADTTGYTSPNTPDLVTDPSRWQRLRFANGNAPGFIAPHWGNVVPFALTSPSAVRPPAPPAFGSPTYMAQLEEVIALLAGLDDRKKTIAEYWADGPRSVQPPGHWQLFGLEVSVRDRNSLSDDIKMFFMLGNAVFDAGIACWDCKRFFDTSRPITAIRHYKVGQSVASYLPSTRVVGTALGELWHPYQSPNFITPPFPEYTSGHSTFSGAAAEVLRRFTGGDQFGLGVTIAPATSSFETGVPGQAVTLYWDTFLEAANEAGSSRLYGGIHFRAGDLEGRRCGKEVGSRVYDICMAYITGSVASPRP